ncbi:iron complex transport system permease protein [Austwickia chelonae]|uniref:Putative iron-siderophore ABC transporter permease protein n=1 Tax=Austwickia chelonae NBRC 105200 TaxID=1184607 RepID=K6VRN7_9MICO|nr:iron ABC transporter permease [Austwickia chelonae]GAB79429.1 putative iron-siderophore ABC transporter permease protein [Austwickia chelonae NBRC 105200]SEW36883.1 iron complex transport system permease protein [Austwickia chelonae]
MTGAPNPSNPTTPTAPGNTPGTPAASDPKKPLAAVLLGLLLPAVLATSLAVGAHGLGPGELWAGLTGTDGHAASIVETRLDRTLIGAVVGAAAALSGTLLQGVTRNPLADPGVLGLTSGASLAVVLTLHLGVRQPTFLAASALTGVILAAAVVAAVAAIAPPERRDLSMVLAGAAVLAAATSLTSSILLMDAEALDVLRFWQVGSVAGRTTDALLAVTPFLLAGAVLALASIGTLDALALGDDLAAALGEHVNRRRLTVLAAAVLLTAGATALAGPVAFVGLVVPHALRRLFGAGATPVLLGSFVAGPVLVVAADTLGRVVMPPSEIQVGIMTALLGAPILVAVARTQGGAR